MSRIEYENGGMSANQIAMVTGATRAEVQRAAKECGVWHHENWREDDGRWTPRAAQTIIKKITHGQTLRHHAEQLWSILCEFQTDAGIPLTSKVRKARDMVHEIEEKINDRVSKITPPL